MPTPAALRSAAAALEPSVSANSPHPVRPDNSLRHRWAPRRPGAARRSIAGHSSETSPLLGKLDGRSISKSLLKSTACGDFDPSLRSWESQVRTLPGSPSSQTSFSFGHLSERRDLFHKSCARLRPSVVRPENSCREAGASGSRQTSEQEIARDLGSSLSSASNRRRGRSWPLSADSMFVVRTSPSSDCAPKASEASQPFALQAATRS